MKTRQAILVVLGILLLGALAVWWYLGFTFDFSRFFAADPGVTGTSVRATPTFNPSERITGMVSCAPLTQTVAVGVSATLTATSGNGTFTWYMPERGLADGDEAPTKTGASITVFYDIPGIKKVTVQSPRGDGSANIDNIACTVVVTP